MYITHISNGWNACTSNNTILSICYPYGPWYLKNLILKIHLHPTSTAPPSNFLLRNFTPRRPRELQIYASQWFQRQLWQPGTSGEPLSRWWQEVSPQLSQATLRLLLLLSMLSPLMYIDVQCEQFRQSCCAVHSAAASSSRPMECLDYWVVHAFLNKNGELVSCDCTVLPKQW